MTSPARIRQADITRALKAAKAADQDVRVTVKPSGELVIEPVESGNKVAEPKQEADTLL